MRKWILLKLLCLAVACSSAVAEEFKVLVFSKTSGFRHGSIADGLSAIQTLGAANGFAVDATEEASEFSASNLSQYRVVIWLSTTGNVLNTAQQDAFEQYIQSGGGYVGVHAATDTEYNWPWYGGLIGGDAWFLNHPSIQDATLDVEDPSHVSTQHYRGSFTFRDEWYNFRNDPRSLVNVLVTIDETTYQGGTMGPGHPISWNHEYDGGRSWYTAMGHRSQTFEDNDFRTHLLGGIIWAANLGSPPAVAPLAVPAMGFLAVIALAGTLFSVGRRLKPIERLPERECRGRSPIS